MEEQQDIYKIAVSVIMIHLMLLFIFEGFTMTSNNPEDSIVTTSLLNVFGTSEGVSSQIAETGICSAGTNSQSQCEANGCVWDNGQCFNAIENNKGINFGFFDVLLSIMKIPLYLGKFLLFIGSIVFFELILSFKLMPLISNVSSILAGLVSITLWVYNAVLIYYLWTFISNFRGTR